MTDAEITIHHSDNEKKADLQHIQTIYCLVDFYCFTAIVKEERNVNAQNQRQRFASGLYLANVFSIMIFIKLLQTATFQDIPPAVYAYNY